MDNNIAPDGAISPGTKVHKSILDRIELLNSSFRMQGIDIGQARPGAGRSAQDGACIPDSGGPETDGSAVAASRLQCGGSKRACAPDAAQSPALSGSRLSTWSLGGAVTLIGQCWSNETESFSGRNNIDQMNEYLESTYGSGYMVYSLASEAKGAHLRQSQVYELSGFNMAVLLEIVKTAKCWLDLRRDGRIIIELRQGREPMVMLVACAILAYTKAVVSAETAFRNLSRDRSFPLAATEAVLRYTRYFDQLFLMRPGWKVRGLLLNQVIVTASSARLLDEEQQPVWLVKDAEGVREVAENYYKDDSFIVFSIMNTMVQGDVELSLCFPDGRARHRLFTLSINTLFYQAGLYRFRYSEIEPSAHVAKMMEGLSDNSIFVDLIFTDAKEVERPCLYVLEQNLVHDLKTLTDHIPGGASKEQMSVFGAHNFNRILAKFCVLMGYTLEQGLALAQHLESLGYRNLIYQATPVQVPSIGGSTDTTPDPAVEGQRPCAAAVEPPDQHVLSRDGCFTITALEAIQDIAVQKAAGTKTGLRARLRKKTPAEKMEPPALVAVQPLHWAALTDVEETIFGEIKELDADIDHVRFEELFCEALRSGPRTSAPSAQQGCLADQRRLFLVSLSVRHLELKNIEAGTLLEIVNDRPEILSMQDLLNIERVLPSEREQEALEAAESGLLSRVEGCMLAYAQIRDLDKKVRILLFERRFCDEIALYRQSLADILLVLNRILDSKELRMVLKIILNIGNAINFSYSVRRKLASGYRLEALGMLSTYAGKRGTTLFDFMMDTLARYSVDVDRLVGDLQLVHSARRDDMAKIREKINALILAYNEQLAVFEAFGKEEQDRYRHIMGCSCKIFMEVGQLHRECSIYSSIVKRKFGEDDSKPIHEIFATLSSFLKRMEDGDAAVI